MNNPMDKIPFNNVQNQGYFDLMGVIQQAQRDPFTFEEQIKRNNPQGYQRALQIRNSANPRDAILQLAQARGMDPNILRMFGLMQYICLERTAKFDINIH